MGGSARRRADEHATCPTAPARARSSTSPSVSTPSTRMRTRGPIGSAGFELISWDDWLAELDKQGLAIRVRDEVPGSSTTISSSWLATAKARLRTRRRSRQFSLALGGGLDRLHILVGKAEVVADLVHQHVGHDVRRGFPRARPSSRGSGGGRARPRWACARSAATIPSCAMPTPRKRPIRSNSDSIPSSSRVASSGNSWTIAGDVAAEVAERLRQRLERLPWRALRSRRGKARAGCSSPAPVSSSATGGCRRSGRRPRRRRPWRARRGGCGP